MNHFRQLESQKEIPKPQLLYKYFQKRLGFYIFIIRDKKGIEIKVDLK